MIPPLLLQPFVENAIWHGLMHREAGGKLTIKIWQEGSLLFCQVTDNGIGREKAALLKGHNATYKKSMGMNITAARLQILNKDHEEKGLLQITDMKNEEGEDCGTKVLLKIPVIVSENVTA
jgi:sensor histidine kinase YesM